MAESYPVGGLGWTNEKDFGTPQPSSTSSSASSTPNPINPLFARLNAQGPLSELESSRYAYKTLRYPLDVETNPRFRYYMKFNILMNIRSQYTEQLSFGDQAQYGGAVVAQTQFGANRIQTAKEFLPSQDSKPIKPTNISALVKTQTVKTQQSISLYMPDTLNWNMRNTWEEVNVTEPEKLGKAGMALSLLSTGAQAITDIVGGIPTLSLDDIKRKLEDHSTLSSGAAILGEAIGRSMGIGGDLGLAAVGFALNPSVEVLYKSPELREFQFQFIFAPRNRKEAETALTIIQMFKFHSAPEFYGGPDLGRYYVPPSQFDIEFIGRDGELWQLGKILPHCVLTNVDVNYGQSGQFAVFEDGTPTNIQLQLFFRETAFLTKDDVEKGY